MAAVADSVYCRPWRREDASEILEMRRRLEESASRQNLKRGAGGTMDVEFIVGMLQLKHGDELPELRVPGTLDGLGAMEVIGRMDFGDAAFLAQSYRFQRSIEARIRLMDAAGRHEFPDDPRERAKLAYLLGYADADKLAREVEDTRRETRERFNKIFAAAS
jgi:glutamate-ammonia-ligase adenylyltransferase